MQPKEKTYLCCTGGTVDRKTGKVTLDTFQGTREQFIACLMPLIRFAEVLQDDKPARSARKKTPRP